MSNHPDTIPTRITKYRGHAIRPSAFEYVDGSGKPTQDRPCGYCDLPNTPEGHDGCLGTLPGVMNACCGHGDPDDAYIQYNDEERIAGAKALYAALQMRDERGRCSMAPRNMGIDHCITELVEKLNEAGMETIASCCGHGFQPMRISLKNGAEILIANYDQAQEIATLFPNINGGPQ